MERTRTTTYFPKPLCASATLPSRREQLSKCVSPTHRYTGVHASVETFISSLVDMFRPVQAAKAMFCQRGGASGTDCRAADPLYTAATASPTVRDSKSTPKVEGLQEQLHAVTKRSMQPFLAERPALQLDDNRSYKAPPTEARPEELFSGRKQHTILEHHSEAVCSAIVHGANQRCGLRHGAFLEFSSRLLNRVGC